jgi:hypothetical protein
MKKIFLITGLIIASLVGISQTQVSNKSRGEILNEQYTTGLFKTANGTIFDIENEISAQAFFNILDWLEGRVAGLQVFVARSGARVPVIRGSVASIFVDEMRMDPSFLNSLSTHDIAMIKVIKGPFAGAVGNGGGGTIAIYTYKGEDEEEDEDSQ